MKVLLYKRDSKGLCRSVMMQLIEIIDHNGEIIKCEITGESGLLGGKKTPRPKIEIYSGKGIGKGQRTIREQADLQYNSILNDFLDKGYKTAEQLGIQDITDFLEVESKVPKINTTKSGVRKPMLALSSDGIKDELFEREWYSSKKYDGVRSMFFWHPFSHSVLTCSRGGKNYDMPAFYIRNEAVLRAWLKDHPDVIFDGEIYIHGKPLAEISGACRLIEIDEERHHDLEYHIYDIVDEALIFEERLKVLKEFEKYLSNFPSCKRIKIVQHEKVSGKENIMKLHDKYVSEGYEGLVLRDPNEKYKCGGRDKRMIKIKSFQSDEYKILDIVDGLRPEDMCFLCETKEGYQFKAKPRGDAELKQWYRNNIETLKGQLITVRYFGYTTTNQPVPNLPVACSLRTKEDL